MASSTEGTHICAKCPATFKHRKHLQRHSTTHTTDRPHECLFCNSGFQRRDVLRRHLKTCSARLERDEVMPNGLQPGKASTSCVSCAVSKKACDQKMPCSICLLKGNVCAYKQYATPTTVSLGPVFVDNQVVQLGDEVVELEDKLEVSGDFMMDPAMSLTALDSEWWNWDNKMPYSYSGQNPFNLVDFPAQTSFSTSPWNVRGGSRFEFLLNFTTTSGLRRSFNHIRRRNHGIAGQNILRGFDDSDTLIGTSNSTLAAVNFSTASPPTDCDAWLADVVATNCPTVHPLLDCDSWLAEVSAPLSELSSSPQFDIQQMIELLDSPLFVRTQEIWSRLCRGHIRAPVPAAGSDLNIHCLRFFRPANLKRFVDLFFDQWYPHWPVLHKPSFDIATAPVLLLVPVILLGACMSEFEKDVADAKVYLNTAEQLVFSHPLLSLDADGDGSNDVEGIHPLKVIQAGYLICLVQNWEGNNLVKRRIRQQRYVAIIAAARDLGFASGNHGTRSIAFDEVDWYGFIRREETIRTFTYIFLLDNGFLIFNNCPPRVMVQELNIELSCPEEVFQAETANQCSALRQTSRENGPLTLVKAIELLSYPEFTLDTANRFSQMSTLNLFAIISGFHTVLFQQRALFLCLPTDLSPLKLALERWNVAWGSRHLQVPEQDLAEPWRETGFIGHAHEFYALAMARLENLYFQRSSSALACSLENAAVPDIGKEKLDETDMRQMTDLMLSLAVSGE